MSLFFSFLLGIALAVCSLATANPVESANLFECNVEQHRPRFHFSGKKNWINDPNGMVYYDGLYHLYFQYHPYSMFDGPKHWGHAISRDMATWIEVPIALYPDELGAIWSGSAVIDYDNTTGFKVPGGLDPLVAIYTSAGNGQKQSIAYSLDNGFTFTKYEGNPVLEAPDKPDFRDPKVYWINGKWIMGLAVLDRVEFYSSPDLKTWTFESEFGRDPPEGSHGGVWECVDLIQLNATVGNEEREFWVLMVSVSGGAYNDGGGTIYLVGFFGENAEGKMVYSSYIWDPVQWIEHGPDNYATVTFANEPKGRKIAMGWVANFMYLNAEPNLAHRGHISLPRELGLYTLNAELNQYRLTNQPVEELKKLRDPTQHIERSGITVPPFAKVNLTEEATRNNPLLEIEINLEWVGGDVSFSLCAANDLDEEVCFMLNGSNWFTDRSKSGNVDFNDNFRSHLMLASPREVKRNYADIKLFLDVTNVEIFADGGLTTMTSLFFPSKPFDQLYFSHWTEGNSQAVVTIKDYNVWGLKCWFPRNEN